MALEKALEAHHNELVLGEVWNMADRQRTADGEGEGTLGERFLSEVVALPRAITGLEAGNGGVSTSATASESENGIHS